MKIGILGGTFDPIHNGHISLAGECRAKLGLDKVLFVPAFTPPHKPGSDITPWKDRFEMVRRAISGMEAFEASDVEMRLKGTSYSINTVNELKRQYGSLVDIYFITGSDSAPELESWKNIEGLKSICTLVIATRPGFEVKERPSDTEYIEVETPDISSTGVRELVSGAADIEGLVPEAVAAYIGQKGLYRALSA